MHIKPAAAVMPKSKNHSWWFSEQTQRHESLTPLVNHWPTDSIIRMADLLAEDALQHRLLQRAKGPRKSTFGIAHFAPRG